MKARFPWDRKNDR